MAWKQVKSELDASSLEMRTTQAKRQELSRMPQTRASGNEKKVIDAVQGRGFAVLQPRN